MILSWYNIIQNIGISYRQFSSQYNVCTYAYMCTTCTHGMHVQHMCKLMYMHNKISDTHPCKHKKIRVLIRQV